MRPTSSDASFLIPEETRRKLSIAIAGLAFLVMAGLGSWQMAKDGSFWIDEASVALSLKELSPGQLVGPLIGGQSFPRFLLLATRGAVALFGYETAVVRALPHVFFLAATGFWWWLLVRRFRDEPVLLALAGLLLVIPAPWFVYGAMLKSYSFDVLLALLPFLLSDRFYDETLAQGRRPLRLLLLTGGGALSYPFAMALLARAGGWWLVRARSGSPRVSPRGVFLLALGMALFAGCLWYTDLRHTSVLGEVLRDYWRKCLVGAEGTGTIALLDRFAIGWWDGRTEFSNRDGLGPFAVTVLRLAVVAGLVRIGALLARPAPAADAATATWGSRSAGCALVVVGLPVASLVGSYPICAGRLTLFALLPMLVMVLEGLAFAAEGLRRLPVGPWLAAAAGVALLAVVAPTSYREAAQLVASPAPDDLRSVLERTRERSELPILTTSCTRKQIETLPEGIAAPVHYIEKGGALTVAATATSEAWLLYVPEPFCRRSITRIRQAAEAYEQKHTQKDGARLIYVRFRQPPPQ